MKTIVRIQGLPPVASVSKPMPLGRGVMSEFYHTRRVHPRLRRLHWTTWQGKAVALLPIDRSCGAHQKNTRPRHECEHARQWTGYKYLESYTRNRQMSNQVAKTVLVGPTSNTVTAAVPSELDSIVFGRRPISSFKRVVDPIANQCCVARPVVDLGKGVVTEDVVR